MKGFPLFLKVAYLILPTFSIFVFKLPGKVGFTRVYGFFESSHRCDANSFSFSRLHGDLFFVLISFCFSILRGAVASCWRRNVFFSPLRRRRLPPRHRSRRWAIQDTTSPTRRHTICRSLRVWSSFTVHFFLSAPSRCSLQTCLPSFSFPSSSVSVHSRSPFRAWVVGATPDQSRTSTKVDWNQSRHDCKLR